MKKTALFLIVILSALLLLSCEHNVNIGGSGTDSGGADVTQAVRTCTVGFDSDGGSSVESQIVEFGGKASAPQTPVKSGYTFENWEYKGEVWSFVGYTVSEDMVLKAVWSKNEYSISFDTNGGEALDARKVLFGDPISLPEPERSGYTFKGWLHNGEKYSEESYNRTENISLTAEWEATEYSVEFLSQDQSIAKISYTVESETFENLPADPEKTGYSFAGWLCDGNEWTFIPHQTTGDFTLTAGWNANSYTVTYNLNGGTGKDSDTVAFESEVEYPVPERAGYTFSGWRYNGAVLSNGIYSVADNITADALWTPIVYTATYKAFGKTVGTESFTVETAGLSLNPSVSSICTAFRIEWAYEIKPEDITVNARYFLGSYEQDDVLSNGAEPIEWMYLGTENGLALMLSKYALDTTYKIEKPETPDTTWEDSFLRAWLNSAFYDSAFTAAEKKYVVTGKITTPENPVLHTPGGNDTTDSVFLLSVQEVLKYFPEYSMTACPVTQFAISHTAQVSGEKTGWWWLRTPGGEPGRFMYLHPTEYWEYPGDIYFWGDFVIRPAIRVAVK